MAKRKKGKRKAGKRPSWMKGLAAARRARNAAKRAGKKHPVRAHKRRVKTRGPRCIKRKGARAYKNPRRSRKKKIKVVRVRAHRSYEAKETCKPRRRRKGKRRSGKRSGSGLTKHQRAVRAGKKAARTRKRNKAARSAARRGSGRGRYRGTIIHRRKGKTYSRSTRSRSGYKQLGSGSGRSKKRKDPKRVAAGRKAARTRAYKKAGGSSYTPPSHQLAAERRHRGHRRGRGRRRSNMLMENPLNGWEWASGTIFGVLGFVAMDAADRYAATHALSTTTNKDAQGHVIYADAQPTAGSYPGLFNGTAVVAPLWKSPMRWFVGTALTAGPLIVSYWIKTPTARAGFQMFGFAAGVRFLGKLAVDLTAKALSYTCVGQRLYDPEIRGTALAAVNGNTSDPSVTGFPTTGLGRRPPNQQLGATPARLLAAGPQRAAAPVKAACKTCGQTNGLGACCGSLNACCPPAVATVHPLPVNSPPAPAGSNPNPGPFAAPQIQGLPVTAGSAAEKRPSGAWNHFSRSDAA